MQKPLVRVSPPPFKKPEHALSFVGSCNGLVAFVSGGSIQTGIPSFHTEISLLIWNPLTGFYKEFIGQGCYFPMRTRGFGHVSATDDYKVVVVAPHDRTHMTEGVFLNEALHWLADEADRDLYGFSEAPVLIAFDLAKEEFRKIQLPCSSRHSMYNWFLGVSCEGFLYGLWVPRYGNRCRDSITLQIWVMREYGNSCSWRSSSCIRIPGDYMFRMIFLEPILLTETCAVVINQSNKTYRFVAEQGIDSDDEDKQELPEDMYKIHHHTEKDNLNVYIVETNVPDMIVYGSLISLC
ncbi:hypothetical protein ACLB2K_000121 [Fragaria x ananassa]